MSFSKNRAATVLVSALALLLPHFALSQVSSPLSSLPSPELEKALSALPTSTSRPPEPSGFPYLILPQSPPNDTLGAGQSRIDAIRVGFPFASSTSLILQFEPNSTPGEVFQFLDRRRLEVLETFPLIGAVKVGFDYSSYFSAADTSVIKALLQVVDDFEADPVIRVATPDLLLQNQQESTNLLNPIHVELADAAGSAEFTGWGVIDIQADQLWDRPGATDGVLFAALDVGFHRHEDLVFSDLPKNINANDHGNHVAGIACAQHNDRGIKGVLPNCFIRARTTKFFLLEGGVRESSVEDTGRSFTDVLDFMSLFGQVIGSLNSFIDSAEGISVLNLSLGYNWRRNFGIGPTHVDWADYQRLVRGQGAMAVSIVEAANTRGIVIFSAAGNDSQGLAEPLDATYASPFNWAAAAVRNLGTAENAVIVEAHESGGRRATFSNVGGHISCPGVDIISTLVFDPDGQPANAAYGEMSGTSMAAPHCAAGYQLLRLVRPEHSGVELLNCMLGSSARSTSGTPMLRLSQAATACPSR